MIKAKTALEASSKVFKLPKVTRAYLKSCVEESPSLSQPARDFFEALGDAVADACLEGKTEVTLSKLSNDEASQALYGAKDFSRLAIEASLELDRLGYRAEFILEPVTGSRIGTGAAKPFNPSVKISWGHVQEF